MDKFPSEIKGYKPVCLCGRGNYGQVWLVVDAVGSFRALKVVSKSALGGDWEREFKGLKLYQTKVKAHPNLIQIFHVEDCGHFFYYTMEAADNLGGANSYIPATLNNRIKQSGPFDFETLVSIFDQLLDGLEHLHESGVIHRDIKPDNIIFVDGVPKIGDIGLLGSVTISLSLAGTQDFVPPEYLTGKEKEVRQSIDIYALGKTLYCAFSGQGPNQFPFIPCHLLKNQNLRLLNRLVIYAVHPKPSVRIQSCALFRELLHHHFGLQYRLKIALYFTGRICGNIYFALFLAVLLSAGLLYAVYGPVMNAFTPKTMQEHMTWTPLDEETFTRLRAKKQRSYDEEVELRMKIEKLSNIADAKGTSRYELTEAGRAARMHRNIYTEDFSFAGWHFLSSQEPIDSGRYIFQGRKVDMLLKRSLPEEFDLKFTLLLPEECMGFTIQLLAEDSIVYKNADTLKKPLPENNPCFFEFSVLADGKFSELGNKNPLNGTGGSLPPRLANTYIGENYFQIAKIDNQVRIFVNERQVYEVFIFPWSKIHLRFLATPGSSRGSVELTELQIYDVAQTTGRGQFRLPLPKSPSSIPMRQNPKKRQ